MHHIISLKACYYNNLISLKVHSWSLNMSLGKRIEKKADLAERKVLTKSLISRNPTNVMVHHLGHLNTQDIRPSIINGPILIV